MTPLPVSHRRFLQFSCVRVLLLCLSLAWATVATYAAGTEAPLAGRRVLWLGDSITQAGDYVTFTEYYLARAFPRDRFDIISIGRSSETLSGLSEKVHPGPRPCLFDRLPRALELVKPTLVVACYGMNDGIYHPASAERMQAFQTGVRRLIAACHKVGAQVVLLTPPPFDSGPVKTKVSADAPDFGYRTPFEGYDKVLADFARWELSLPAADAQVIDLHGPMEAYIADRRQRDPSFGFTRDGIHPDTAGHLLMAQIILRGLGVKVPSAGALEADLATVQADPLYPLVKRQRETRSGAWLQYVGLPGAVEKAEGDVAQLQTEIDALRATPAVAH